MGHHGTSRPFAVSRRAGFTLVELLVVVAIISLLVAMLMPALHAAREQAVLAVCQSQLRSVGTGLFLYTSEHDEWMPGSRKAGAYGHHLRAGADRVHRLGLLYFQNDSFSEVTSRYLSAFELLKCPGRQYANDGFLAESPYWQVPGFNDGFWGRRAIGYSYCVPNSYTWDNDNWPDDGMITYRLGEPIRELRVGSIVKPATWRWGEKWNSLVACFCGGNSDYDYRTGPHGLRGFSTLFATGSVQFVRRPEGGWGYYSWVPERPAEDNLCDYAPFWGMTNSAQ